MSFHPTLGCCDCSLVGVPGSVVHPMAHHQLVVTHQSGLSVAAELLAAWRAPQLTPALQILLSGHLPVSSSAHVILPNSGVLWLLPDRRTRLCCPPSCPSQTDCDKPVWTLYGCRAFPCLEGPSTDACTADTSLRTSASGIFMLKSCVDSFCCLLVCTCHFTQLWGAMIAPW